jgi:hypothetical protein
MIDASAMNTIPNVQYYSAECDTHNLGIETFSTLRNSIAVESALLHPTPDALLESFESGQAIIALDNERQDRPIGFVRFEPLLSDSIREGLGLTCEFPEIAELATMFVENDPRYRGQRHMSQMCDKLFETKHQELVDGELLVIGTAKDYRVIRTLQGISSARFEVCHHLDLPHLAALTCICSGNFGSGFQNNPRACGARLDNYFIGKIDELANFLKESESTKIPCVMFVSDKDIAHQIDQQLAKLFNTEMSVIALRDRLNELGYYPDNKPVYPIESLYKGVEHSLSKPS